MKVIETIQGIRDWSREIKRSGRTIGFVPTMGYLHEGHTSLMKRAREEADVVVASLFVNPTQFGPNEDYTRYPRDFARDEALCRAADVAALFHPSADEMYGGGYSVFVDEADVSKTLDGEFRPGHFRGVLTVVAKLFLAVEPDMAVFGRKDAQQLWLIHKMVSDMNMPVRVVAGPTIREPDGLAMSSRNAYLDPAQRAQAVCLSQALNAARATYRDGERNAYALRKTMLDIIETQPDARMDYAEIVDARTFSPVTTINRRCTALMAVRFGATRLIDNMDIGEESIA